MPESKTIYAAPTEGEHSELLGEAAELLTHACQYTNGVIGWPQFQALSLSASVQGRAVSLLIRAYRLTGNEKFLHTAHGAVRAFELDIFDGGVSTPLGVTGIFFEEVASYPATHALTGHLLALLGLFDYVSCTGESSFEALLQSGLATLSMLLDAFDTGYWTRIDLLHGQLASTSSHMLHAALLQELAERMGSDELATIAARWQHYQHHPLCRLRAFIQHRMRACCASLRRRCFHPGEAASSHNAPSSVCVPITAFPVPGGMRSVLAGVTSVMNRHWQMAYLTHHKGEDAHVATVKQFGGKYTSPWYFPLVWLYSVSGFIQLALMLRREPDCQLILPQDGVFTGVFAALAGQLAGKHVVCMDHGNITWLDNALLNNERREASKSYPQVQRMLAHLHFAAYNCSLRLMARLATHYSDLFLVAGDEVNEVYRYCLNVPAWRIIRYAYTVDVARFTPPDRERRVRMREAEGLTEEALVVSLINRLAPEKGLHVALEGIALAAAALPAHVRARLKVLIAGDGPLRPQVEADIRHYRLESTCILWGTASPAEVVMLLGISDIFLYSGTRGTNYSMAVLEAMAAACAVIASTSPLSNAHLLANQRGMAVAPANAPAIGEALTRLCSDPLLCQQMGEAAREYVATHHSSAVLQRALLRASFFVPALSESIAPLPGQV